MSCCRHRGRVDAVLARPRNCMRLPLMRQGGPSAGRMEPPPSISAPSPAAGPSIRPAGRGCGDSLMLAIYPWLASRTAVNQRAPAIAAKSGDEHGGPVNRSKLVASLQRPSSKFSCAAPTSGGVAAGSQQKAVASPTVTGTAIPDKFQDDFGKTGGRDGRLWSGTSRGPRALHG